MLLKAVRCSLCGRFGVRSAGDSLASRYGMCGSCARGLRGRVHKSEFDATFPTRVLQVVEGSPLNLTLPIISNNRITAGSFTATGPAPNQSIPGLIAPYYATGSQGGAYSTTSSSLVAVDATNLSILTPVVPNTSSVRIRATATVEALGAPNVQFQLAISDSVNGIIGVVQGMTAATGGSLPVTVEAVLAGGGQFAHTFELWWAVITAAATLSMLNGSNGTPFPLMIVEVNQ